MTTMRRKINALRTIAELHERFPDLPAFTITGNSKGDELRFACYVWGAYVFPTTGRAGKSYEQLRREDIEQKITKIMDAFNTVLGQPLEWTKNDPTESSHDETYYRMEAPLGPVAEVSLIAERAIVCQKVVVLETEEEVEEKDPELVAKALEGIPTVKVKKPKEIVEWQCNEVIAAKANEVFAK